jgi:hypothetical protein
MRMVVVSALGRANEYDLLLAVWKFLAQTSSCSLPTESILDTKNPCPRTMLMLAMQQLPTRPAIDCVVGCRSGCNVKCSRWGDVAEISFGDFFDFAAHLKI